jgi:hypothetical protein
VRCILPQIIHPEDTGGMSPPPPPNVSNHLQGNVMSAHRKWWSRYELSFFYTGINSVRLWCVSEPSFPSPAHVRSHSYTHTGACTFICVHAHMGRHPRVCVCSLTHTHTRASETTFSSSMDRDGSVSLLPWICTSFCRFKLFLLTTLNPFIKVTKTVCQKGNWNFWRDFPRKISEPLRKLNNVWPCRLFTVAHELTLQMENKFLSKICKSC